MSAKLNESVHAVVRHMIHTNRDVNQSLILDVNSFVDYICTLAPYLHLMYSLLIMGCPYSLDWTAGLDYWTGLLDCMLVLKSKFY